MEGKTNSNYENAREDNTTDTCRSWDNGMEKQHDALVGYTTNETEDDHGHDFNYVHVSPTTTTSDNRAANQTDGQKFGTEEENCTNKNEEFNLPSEEELLRMYAKASTGDNKFGVANEGFEPEIEKCRRTDDLNDEFNQDKPPNCEKYTRTKSSNEEPKTIFEDNESKLNNPDLPEKRRRRKKRRERKSKENLKLKDSGVESDQSLDVVRKIKKRHKREKSKNRDRKHLTNGNELLEEAGRSGTTINRDNHIHVSKLPRTLCSLPPLETVLTDTSKHQRTEYDMFTARPFSAISRQSIVSDANSLDSGNAPDDIKNKRTKRQFKVKDLKKASSKVFVTQEPLPPVSSRLDLAKTARSQTGEDFGLSMSETDGEELKEPLLLCTVLTRFPIICFLVLTLLHCAVIGTTLGLVLRGYDVFPAVFDTLPLYIYNEPRLRELSWRNKNDYPGFIYRPVYGLSFNSGYRGQVKDTFEMIFESQGDNVLTPQHLRLIKMAEEKLSNHSRYRKDFCMLDRFYNCVKPQSLLRLFDGTYAHIDAAFLDPGFSNICDVVYKAYTYNETREFVTLFLGKDSVIQPNRCSTSITRSLLLIGWPLYVINGHFGTQTDIQEFLANVFKPLAEEIRDYDVTGMFNVSYLSKLLYEYDLVKQALTDIKLAIGSFVFIFVFMCIQTGSIVVTFLGILSIFSSFLLTNLFYRYALSYKYFGFFHVIAIFLILGIGADDLFVFYDTWRLTGHNVYPTDAHRMSDCFRKAAKTTFVTSVTTMVAFLVSGLSPLLPVKTFGIFAGILIILNYVWVIIYFPAIIMLHHTKTKYIWKWFRNLFLYCCFGSKPPPKLPCRSCCKSDGTNLSETNSARNLTAHAECSSQSSSQNISVSSENCKTNTGLPSTSSITTQIKSDKTDGRQSNLKLYVDRDSEDLAYRHHIPETLDIHKIESQTHREEYLERKKNKPKKNFEDRNVVIKFLRNGFYDLMTKRVVKILVPVAFLAVSIFFIVSATKIEPDTEQLKLFRSDHNYAKATARHYSSFMRNLEDEYQRVYLVWGIREADISQCDQKSGQYCFGQARFDNSFNMNSEAAQSGFKDLCQRLETMDRQRAQKLRIREDINGHLKIHCFTGDFEQFFENEISTKNYPVNADLSLPINQGNVTYLTNRYSYIYREQLPPDFGNYFEILVGYWLTNGYSLYPTESYIDYNNLFGEQLVSGTTKYAYYNYSGLYYGSRLKYLAVEINTTMNLYNMGHEEGLPIYDDWENLMQEINGRMPASLQNGIQIAENLWHWLHVQKTLSDSAITGIMVGLLFAWPILVLTTLNVIIGTIATLTIGLVTACVVGLIPLAGWKLGVLESINLCMVVGLSVDYIVHLAEAYRSSKSTRRMDRVYDMLESIGLSVVSGAITTIGAAIFMLFAKIQFFFQFGIFIISTVGIALLFSLLGFTTLLSLCGPQGNTGCLKALARTCVKLCANKDNSNETESDGAKSKRGCPCVSPSIVLERIYDWVSYGSLDD